MRFRKLRIAWSVGWGVVVVLLCVLWVRSYWWWDNFSGGFVQSVRGTTFFYLPPNTTKATWDQTPMNNAATMLWEKILGPGPSARFGVMRGSGIRVVLLPHWFDILFVASIAAAPWLRWRFSLRTLLIATTLVAAVLGLIAWMAKS